METKKSLRLANGSWDFQNDPMFKKYLHLIDEVVDEGPTKGIFDKDYPNDWWCYLKEGYHYDGQGLIHEPTRRIIIDCLKQVEKVMTSTNFFEVPKNWPKKVKENVEYITNSEQGYFFRVVGCSDELFSETTAEMLKTCKELVESLELIEA